MISYDDFSQNGCQESSNVLIRLHLFVEGLITVSSNQAITSNSLIYNSRNLKRILLHYLQIHPRAFEGVPLPEVPS